VVTKSNLKIYILWYCGNLFRAKVLQRFFLTYIIEKKLSFFKMMMMMMMMMMMIKIWFWLKNKKEINKRRS